MRLTLLAVLIAAALPAQAADLKALQCGNVFDSKTGKLIGPQTIVVEKTTIESLSPGKLAVDGAQIVDLSQMTCMPGFIDMHVHLGQQSSPQSYTEGFRLDDIDFALRAVGYADKTLQAGFTSVRDLGGEISLHHRYYPEIVRPKAARIGSQIQTTFSNAYKAGVKIAFGTDMGVGPHGENASEFIYMTEAGMPANAALQTATYNAAQILAPDELGQLQAGFKADVVAVAGNPLTDISLTKKIAFVMKDGVIYKDESK